MLLEKARVIDPFGHARLTPLGEIRMTLAGEIKMTPVEASAGEFFVALRLLVLARRGSISKTTKYDCKIKNIATHSMRLAMSRKVGMIGGLIEDEVESACNPFRALLHP